MSNSDLTMWLVSIFSYESSEPIGIFHNEDDARAVAIDCLCWILDRTNMGARQGATAG